MKQADQNEQGLSQNVRIESVQRKGEVCVGCPCKDEQVDVSTGRETKRYLVFLTRTCQ